MGEASRKNLFRNPIFHLFLITIVGLLAYSNTFNVPFQFDDSLYIIDNYNLRDLNNLWPPLESRWFGFLTFALNYHLGGLDVTGYHIVNLITHTFSAILVYFLVALTLRTPYFSFRNADFGIRNSENSTQHSAISYQDNIEDEKIRRWEDKNFSTSQLPNFQTSIALFSALLFVSHPIQTQAVTYIVQRFASLATFFYLLSLVMYIKFRIHDTKKMHDAGYTIHDKENHTSCIMNRESCIVSHASCIMYLASLFSAILAMKTKETAFTLPLIIVLHELMFFSDSRFTIHDSRFKKRVLFLIPFLLTMLIIPLSFIGPELNIYKPEISIGEEIRQGQLKEATILSRHAYSLTQFRILVTYIRLLFFPINLNINYDYPIFSSFLNPEVFLAFMFLLIFFAFGIYLFYASRVTHCALRLVAFGIFWFFVTLSVESSVIPIKDVIFEHRLYLPSVGLIIAFSTGLFLTLQRVISTTVRQNDRTTEWGSSFSFPPIDLPLYCAVALIIFLSITTYQRNVIWQDRVSLWKDVVYKSPNNAKGHNNLGVAIYLAKGLLDEAIKHYQIALKIKPDYPEAHYNLGNVYRNKGWLDKAIEHYQIAIRLKPDYPETHNNLGIAYSQKNRTDKAIEHYQIAIRLRPDYPEAYYNLGILYKNNGMLDEAITCLQIAIRLKPDYSEAYYYLGEAYYAKGWNDKAMEYYNIARRLKADQK